MTDRPFKVLLVDQDADDARATREKLSGAQVVPFQVSVAESLLAALNHLARGAFDVALVDLELPDSHGLETLTTLQRHAPGMPVVLQTARGGEMLAPKAMELGAQDYLVKGVMTSDALVRVLTYAIARSRSSIDQHAAAPPKAGITGVLGAKGGVGTTTVACYHALELAAQTKERILLMDLDLSGSSSAFLLKASSEYSVADASMNLHRLDAQFWAGLVGDTRFPIDLLQAPGAQRFDSTLDGERVRHVLRFVRTRYDRIVVDRGRLNTLSLTLMEEMRDLYLVTTPDLPALFEASRVLKRLIGLGMVQDQLRLVLNRIGRGAASSPRDISQALGYPVYAALGDHGAELAEMFGEGRLTAPGSHLRRQVAQFTGTALGSAPKPSAGVVRGLLRLARA